MTEAKSPCQEWANMLAPFSLAARLLKEHGRVMPFKPSKVTGKLGQCYMNAYRGRDDGLDYVEGYAMRPGLIPLDHAWLVDADGNAIDPTWDDGASYFGVTFKREFVDEVAYKTGVYGILGTLYMLRDLGTAEDVYNYLVSGLKEPQP